MMPLGHVESEDGTCQSSVGVPRTGVTQGESRKLWLHRLMRDDPAALALFMNPEIKVTGRVCAVSEATRRRNPNLFGGGLVGVSPLAPSGQDEKMPIANAAKRIRQDTKPKLNKLETEYLGVLTRNPGIKLVTIVPQGIRFELGNGIWYKPDFTCLSIEGYLRAYEVKGPHAFRGGFENLKVAARLYHWIRWALVWKDNGTWREQHVLP